jgi:diadenosine tetraphosphatase ApaH/serine/threonine PP2A family protein phosphatase
MRYLVLSDIHANLEALEAVLAQSDGGYDGVLVLGDLVGYGADPNAVAERIRALGILAIVRGNHDKVAVGIDSVEGFNHLARQAIKWTGATLTPDNHAWLAALPQGPAIVDDLVEICHGAPFDEDVYLFDELDAQRAFRTARRPLCLFGHTHVPAIFSGAEDLRPASSQRPGGVRLSLEQGINYLVNCGAVGQPRDGDPRAGYGVVDTTTRTLDLVRVEYDIAAAQEKIIAAGLPDVLAHRLAVGR